MGDITVSGMDEILKKLKILPEKIQKRVVVGAVRAGAKPIVKEAKRLVPNRTGTLKKSIGVVKRRSKDKNIIHFSVTPKKGKDKKYDGFYGAWVEFGHPLVKKKKTIRLIPARPFMRPAYEKEGKNAIESTREYMAKRVPKEIAKL